MKIRLMSFLLAICGIQAVSAQRINPNYISLPVYQMPKQTDYVNYESYGLYACFPATEYQINGFYFPEKLQSLKADTLNGDFKIIVEFTRVVKPKSSSIKDSTIIVADEMAAKITAYDKSGKEFYREEYRTPALRAAIPGVYKKKDEAVDNLLMKALIEQSFPYLLGHFADNYLIQVKNNKSVVLGFANFWAMNPKEIVEEVMENVEAFENVQTPEALLELASKQLPFWEKLTAFPETKEDVNKLYCGLYNSALLYYLLGNQEKSDQFFEKASVYEKGQQKHLNNDFRKKKESVSLSVFKKPDVSDAKVLHEKGFKAEKDMAAIVEQYLYFVASGSITLTDGTTIQGKCMVKRISEDTKEGGQILSFSGSDYAVVVKIVGGEKKDFKLADLKEIKTAETEYLCSKSTIQRAEYRSDKVSLYKEVFPEEKPWYKYRKGDGKLESPSLFGSTAKWQKKFFFDCPELVQKIDAKEMKEPLELVRFYDKECK